MTSRSRGVSVSYRRRARPPPPLGAGGAVGRARSPAGWRRANLGDERLVRNSSSASWPDRHGNVAVAGEEDDRQRGVGGGQLALQVETAQPGQAHVEDQAAGTSFREARGRPARSRTPRRSCPRTCRSRRSDSRTSGRRRRRRRWGRPALMAARQGEVEGAPCVRLGVAPQPAAVRLDDRRLIESPIPMPPGLVVKNALKRWFHAVGADPTPASWTAPGRDRRRGLRRMTSSRVRSSIDVIASMPFTRD